MTEPTTAACRCDEDDHVHCHHHGAPCCHCDCPGRPTTAAFGSPEYVAGVREGLNRLRVLTDEHGFNKGAVMFLTGLTADEVDDLGGMTDGE